MWVFAIAEHNKQMLKIAIYISVSIFALSLHAAESVSGGQSSARAADTSAYRSEAEKCGDQAECKYDPKAMGKRSMCGRSVGEMIQCFSAAINHGNACKSGDCGDGRSYIQCSGGQMTACGYVKESDTSSPKCKEPGAVLSYNTSPTARGQKYGHVEFVCGANPAKYCSVYKQPLSHPWPKAPPDACWVPKS